LVTSRLQNLMMPSPAALGFFREELGVARSVFLLAVDPAAGFVIVVWKKTKEKMMLRNRMDE
jgi:hypothetical protein